MWDDIPILTVLFRLKAIGILNSMKILKTRELYEVEMRINELNGCGVALYRCPTFIT